VARFDRLIALASRADRLGLAATRLGLVVVLLWVGGTMACRFGAEGPAPVAASPPLLSSFSAQPAPEYRPAANGEGAVVPSSRTGSGGNPTYPLAPALGAVLVACGLMIAAHPWLPRLAAVGSFLVLALSLGTLSFLVMTPDGWVPAPGGQVVQGALLLGVALVTMADSARASLRGKGGANTPAEVVVPIDEWEEEFANRSITSAT
jgi:uncharacterized membrane protein YkgB